MGHCRGQLSDVDTIRLLPCACAKQLEECLHSSPGSNDHLSTTKDLIPARLHAIAAGSNLVVGSAPTDPYGPSRSHHGSAQR